MNESKFGGPCLICNEWIPSGNKILWKKEIGIIHSDCHFKIERIEELTNDAIFYLNQNLLDDAYKCLNQIKKLKDEIGIDSSFKISQVNSKIIVEKIDQLFHQIRQDPKWKKLAESSFQTFHRHFKKRWFEFVKGFGIDFSDIEAKTNKMKLDLGELENSEDIEALVKEIEELEKNRKQLLMWIKEEAKLIYDEIRPRNEIIFDPSHPYENRILFKKLLANASKYIFWIDKYFDSNSLDVLMSHIDFQINNTKSIKILSTIHRIKKIKDFKNKFQILQKELAENQDVEIQLRLITNKQNDKDEHDRYLVTEKNVFGGVSIGYMFKSNCTISPLIEKNNEEEIRNLVNGWWEFPDTLDIIKDWDKIDSILKNEIYYKYNCDGCKNIFYREIQLRSNLKYCSTCFPKYMR